MQQLSGGQQTIVALALIFAIQRCDPFPFYLFDELLANLDSAHRASVAQLIHRQSRIRNGDGEEEEDIDEDAAADKAAVHEASAQFICTTFHHELLATADRFHGVVYSNKVSLVREISRDDARKILEQNEKKIDAMDNAVEERSGH